MTKRLDDEELDKLDKDELHEERLKSIDDLEEANTKLRSRSSLSSGRYRSDYAAATARLRAIEKRLEAMGDPCP